jgi:hypothetical protein
MMTMRFTLEDTALIQGHVRREMDKGEMSLMQAYCVAEKIANQTVPVGHEPGYYIGPDNTPIRIKHSIPKEHGGSAKEFIVNPLRVVTADADDEQETPEVEELQCGGVSVVEDFDDEQEDETSRVERAADQAATESEEGDSNELPEE